MAHELEIIDGRASMAYAGETPWHGLGKSVPNDLTPEQMLEAANLDWSVEKVKAFIEYDGKKTYTGQEALVRSSDGKILTNVGPNWEPCQNAEAFGFFHDFVMEGDMEMHTAGSLKGGQIVWALAKVKDSFELFGGDQVDSYLLFSNPHQYGKSIDVRFTPIRVVCNNTLTFSLQTESKNAVTISHRRKFDGDEVKAMMGIASNKLSTYKETAEFLGSKRFTSEKLNEYFGEVFPLTSNKKEAELSRNAKLALDIMESQPGAEYAEGSWWQAFNAVTYMTDHLLSREADTRLANAWFGTMRAKKIQALDRAVEFANAA